LLEFRTKKSTELSYDKYKMGGEQERKSKRGVAIVRTTQFKKNRNCRRRNLTKEEEYGGAKQKHRGSSCSRAAGGIREGKGGINCR